MLAFPLANPNHVQTAGLTQSSIARDGNYIGIEQMPNLTPDDPDASWSHENTLVVRNDEAILDKVPVVVSHGKKEYSASDGGFLTYRARFVKKDGGQIIVSLRLCMSDYILFPVGKHDQYTEIKSYPVNLSSDEIEFGGVKYTPAKVEKSKLNMLLKLLRTEPLEKTGTSRWRQSTVQAALIGT